MQHLLHFIYTQRPAHTIRSCASSSSNLFKISNTLILAFPGPSVVVKVVIILEYCPSLLHTLLICVRQGTTAPPRRDVHPLVLLPFTACAASVHCQHRFGLKFASFLLHQQLVAFRVVPQYISRGTSVVQAIYVGGQCKRCWRQVLEVGVMEKAGKQLTVHLLPRWAWWLALCILFFSIFHIPSCTDTGEEDLIATTHNVVVSSSFHHRRHTRINS